MRRSYFNIAIFLIKYLALLGISLPLYAGVQQYSSIKYLSHHTTSISTDESTSPEASSPCSPFSPAILPTLAETVPPSFSIAGNLLSKGFTLKRYLITHSGNDPPALTTA